MLIYNISLKEGNINLIIQNFDKRKFILQFKTILVPKLYLGTHIYMKKIIIAFCKNISSQNPQMTNNT
jgi:hypothetical protein